MEKLILSKEGQLAFFNEPNVAEILLDYCKVEDDIHHAVMFKQPYFKSEKEWLKSRMKPEELALVENFVTQITPTDIERVLANRSYFCTDVQLKIFELPKAVVMKILMSYCQSHNWELCEEAQIKLIELFPANDVKRLCQKTTFKLSEEAYMKAYDVYTKEEFASLLAETHLYQVNVLQRIFLNLTKDEIKAFLFTFMEQGGRIADEIQRRLFKLFSAEELKEIFLKHLEKTGELGNEVKIKIMIETRPDFEYEDALEIFRESSKKENRVEEDVLLNIADSFEEKDAKELFLNYIEGDVYFPNEIQLNIMENFTKSSTDEILKAYKKKGGELCPECKAFLSRQAKKEKK